MTFSDDQMKALKAKLDHRYVKEREQNGATLSYVEGWHVIAEANRIFGFDNWDRQTLGPRCLWSNVQRGVTVCCYAAKVRISVRAGVTVTIREGMGTGLSRSQLPEEAHELALKAAETDATKRALATFGNPFGLALYDRKRTGVTKPRLPATARLRAAQKTPPLVLVCHDDKRSEFADADNFVAAANREIERLTSVSAVYVFWEANLESLVELHRRAANSGHDPVAAIVHSLKAQARFAAQSSALALPPPDRGQEEQSQELMFPKEKRLRSKGHLVFVAQQPCLVCGRRPAQAHHLRFAQPRAMAMKVSDEFTLPLCNVHHDEIHKTGDERSWWARHGIIEPLKYAARLWAASGTSPYLDAEEAGLPTNPIPGPSRDLANGQ